MPPEVVLTWTFSPSVKISEMALRPENCNRFWSSMTSLACSCFVSTRRGVGAPISDKRASSRLAYWTDFFVFFFNFCLQKFTIGLTYLPFYDLFVVLNPNLSAISYVTELTRLDVTVFSVELIDVAAHMAT